MSGQKVTVKKADDQIALQAQIQRKHILFKNSD